MLYHVAVTLGAVKTSILRPVGKQDDTDALATAGEILNDVVQTLNLQPRDWKFLRASSSYNVTSDGTLTLSTATSPRIHKVYSVVGPNGPLDYVPKHQFDTYSQGGQNILGGPYVYTGFTMGTDNILKIHAAPTATTAFTVNYLKLLAVPSADNVTFADLPEPVITYLRAEGRARVIAEYGGSEAQLGYWDGKARESLKNLILYDMNSFPDHIVTAVSSSDYSYPAFDS